jgi:phosphate-selective porin
MDLANSFDRRDVHALSNVSLRRPTTSTLDTNGNDFRNPLVDAYIKVHGLIPHHDSQIGQFQPKVGMEGVQNDGTLDFCERSMIGILASGRDVGSQLHGTWMDDRIQYWLGVFNTPGTWLEGADTQANRADNNDLKSFLVSAQFRPVWKNETWGSLELGGSAQFNKTGEAGNEYSGTIPDTRLDGLNMRETDNMRYYGYVSYAPGGPVKGWWLKGEYAWIRGRLASAVEYDTLLESHLYLQENPGVYDTSGWYVSTGYKLSDSIWADNLPCWLKPAEFTFRYQTYGNIQLADRTYTEEFLGDRRHQVFKTSIYTAGVNYYIKGHNAKIQVNYNWVNEPDGDHGGSYILDSTSRNREVNNDNLVVNFQVMW